MTLQRLSRALLSDENEARDDRRRRARPRKLSISGGRVAVRSPDTLTPGATIDARSAARGFVLQRRLARIRHLATADDDRPGVRDSFVVNPRGSSVLFVADGFQPGVGVPGRFDDDDVLLDRFSNRRED